MEPPGYPSSTLLCSFELSRESLDASSSQRPIQCWCLSTDSKDACQHTPFLVWGWRHSLEPSSSCSFTPYSPFGVFRTPPRWCPKGTSLRLSVWLKQSPPATVIGSNVVMCTKAVQSEWIQTSSLLCSRAMRMKHMELPPVLGSWEDLILGWSKTLKWTEKNKIPGKERRLFALNLISAVSYSLVLCKSLWILFSCTWQHKELLTNITSFLLAE